MPAACSSAASRSSISVWFRTSSSARAIVAGVDFRLI